MKSLSVLGGLLILVTSLIGSNQAFAHGGYPSDTIPAAHTFARQVEHFQHVIENEVEYSHLADDVEHLAEAADQFHHAVEGGAPFRHAMRDFFSLRMQYDHVRQAFYRAHDVHHDSHVANDWNKVEQTFGELARSIRLF